MPEQTYLFVDGAYLREVYNRLIEHFFGVPGKLDLGGVMRGTGANRAFYYDCLHDIKKDGENDSDFQKRVSDQRSEFDAIQSLPGVHLRLGSLSGKPPRLRQKKVDVLLAVEALDHAFRRNMTTACLIAGDLDFAPLVDSLVRLGVFVRVYYEKTSAARELYAAADMGQPVTLSMLYGWSESLFQTKYPLPQRVTNAGPPPASAGYQLVQEGSLNDELVQLWQDKRGCYYLFLRSHQGGYWLQVSDPNRKLLESFFDAEYGHIAWQKVSDQHSPGI